MATVYLGLGSNTGDRKNNLTQALKLLSKHAEIKQLSSIYETEPVGYLDQSLFLNAICCISTKLSPEGLLHSIKNIESAMGRVPSFPNAPRPIDIDILLFNNIVISTSQLTIPHPQLTKRAFVLIPLAEIASSINHPINKKTMSELLNNLNNTTGISKWAEADEIWNRRHNVSDIC